MLCLLSALSLREDAFEISVIIITMSQKFAKIENAAVCKGYYSEVSHCRTMNLFTFYVSMFLSSMLLCVRVCVCVWGGGGGGEEESSYFSSIGYRCMQFFLVGHR